VDHLQDLVVAGRGHKDAIVLANQFSIGRNAGGYTIEQEWRSYQRRDWHDSECHALSTASWRLNEGYLADPINLPDGTILTVVHSGDQNRQMDAALALGTSLDDLGTYSDGRWSKMDALAEFEKRNPGAAH
jgi:hypothetical protein